MKTQVLLSRTARMHAQLVAIIHAVREVLGRHGMPTDKAIAILGMIALDI